MVLINLRRHLDERAHTGGMADVACAGRIGGRLGHAASLQAAVAADLAAAWQATRHTSRARADRACGCPPTCASCRAGLGANHDPACPWACGSDTGEYPVIDPSPTVLAAHLHRPGCPQAARRPGGLFQRINAAGDVQCLICAAVNTIDRDSFDNYGGTIEHHYRCTFCRTDWSWCDMNAVR